MSHAHDLDIIFALQKKEGLASVSEARKVAEARGLVEPWIYQTEAVEAICRTLQDIAIERIPAGPFDFSHERIALEMERGQIERSGGIDAWYNSRENTINIHEHFMNMASIAAVGTAGCLPEFLEEGNELSHQSHNLIRDYHASILNNDGVTKRVLQMMAAAGEDRPADDTFLGTKLREFTTPPPRVNNKRGKREYR